MSSRTARAVDINMPFALPTVMQGARPRAMAQFCCGNRCSTRRRRCQCAPPTARQVHMFSLLSCWQASHLLSFSRACLLIRAFPLARAVLRSVDAAILSLQVAVKKSLDARDVSDAFASEGVLSMHRSSCLAGGGGGGAVIASLERPALLWRRCTAVLAGMDGSLGGCRHWCCRFRTASARFSLPQPRRCCKGTVLAVRTGCTGCTCRYLLSAISAGCRAGVLCQRRRHR